MRQPRRSIARHIYRQLKLPALAAHPPAGTDPAPAPALPLHWPFSIRPLLTGFPPPPHLSDLSAAGCGTGCAPLPQEKLLVELGKTAPMLRLLTTRCWQGMLRGLLRRPSAPSTGCYWRQGGGRVRAPA